MPMSIRLDPETKTRIQKLARGAGKSRSWVVREAVAAYQPAPAAVRLAERLAPFIGAGDTGRTDLSERTGDRLTELVRRKARARVSR
jgi:predicted DNA-binding protein